MANNKNSSESAMEVDDLGSETAISSVSPVQNPEKSTIPKPAELTEGNLNSDAKSQYFIGFEMIGNSMIPNDMPISANNEKTFKIIVELNKAKMKAKMRDSILFNAWSTYHKEIVEELTSESFLRSQSLQIYDFRMLENELKKELDHFLEIQKIIFSSVETTCRSIGGRVKNDFFQSLFTILTPHNLEQIDLVATTMHKRKLDSESKNLESPGANVLFMSTLIQEETKECLHLIENIKKAMKEFKKLMMDLFNHSECFSDSKLDDYIQKAMKSAASHCTDEPGLPAIEFANKIFNTFISPQFIKQNKENQAYEKELILSMLLNYYKKEMEYFFPSNRFGYEKDLKKLHERLISDVTEVISIKLDLTRVNLDVQTVILELENELEERYVVRNEMKVEEVIHTMKNEVSNLEIEFCEIINKTIERDIVSDIEFDVLHKKTQHHVLGKLLDKINSTCPEEESNGRYINWLSRLTESHFNRLKMENARSAVTREKEGVPGPIMVIQFGLTHLRVGIQHKERFEVINIETLSEVPNVVTISKSNRLLVGNACADKMYQVFTIDVLMEPTSLPNLPLKNNQVLPVNLKFISSLIFMRLKEICEMSTEITFETVVITVPLWFGSSQKQDIKDAATIAGFKQSLLINDTSALALHNLSQSPKFEYDFKKNNQHFVVIVIENNGIYSAVYSMNECEIISMVTNYGHQKHSQRSWSYDPDHITAIKHTLKLDQFKKIKFGVVICRDRTKKEQSENELHKNGISILMSENGILRGGAKYAHNFMENICSAKQAVQDKTFYDLCIDDNDKSVGNQKFINRLTNCLSSACNYTDNKNYMVSEKKNSIEIYESAGRFRKTIERIEGKSEQAVSIACFTNNEGIYSVSSFPGTLSIKNSRQEDIQRYKKLIVDNFTPDKEFESMKCELQTTAEYIVENIKRVNIIYRDDTEDNAKRVLALLRRYPDQDISKEKIIESLKELNVVKKQIQSQ